MKYLKTLMLVFVLVLSLGLNVATVTVSSVATAMSVMVTAVSGASTVVSKLRQKAAQKDKRITELTKQLDSPRVTYRGGQKPLKEAVSDTVTRISRRTAIGSGRNVAAVFGEGIPFIGVGVAVAVTGYELKDGCDTLADLRQLELAVDPTTVRSAEETEVCGTTVPNRWPA